MKKQDNKYLDELLRNEAHVQKHIRKLKKDKTKDKYYYEALALMLDTLSEVRARLYIEYKNLYDNSKEE